MKLTSRPLPFAFACALALSCVACAAAHPETAQNVLRLVHTIPLPAAVSGPFDHFGLDLKTHRLFATAEDHHAVLVINIDTGSVIHEISVTKPHAVLFREDLNRIYVTDGTDGSLKVFDGATYELRQRIALNKDADSIAHDPTLKLLYVVSGGKDAGQKSSTVSVIDTTAEKKLTDIEVDGDTLEAMVLDSYRPRLYINNPARNEIDVINRWNKKIVGAWPVTLGKRNVAIALDEPHQRLFTACRSGQLVVFDTNTGKELQSVPITGGVDDLTYDATSARIYAAGDGVVDVIGQLDADHYQPLGQVPTGPLARTAKLVPDLNRYFVAVPQSGSASASVAALEPLNVLPSKPTPPSDAELLKAPFAENLVLTTLSAHPDLRKLGLHAVPPGQSESVIVANGNAGRIGIKSTQGDLDAVKDGNTYCARKDDGAFYNMKLPLLDASGNRIGILVMEIPFTSAANDAEAIRMAESIRKELAEQIPDLTSLFRE